MLTEVMHHYGLRRRPVDDATVETIRSRRIDDLELQRLRHGDVRALCAPFDARQPEIRQLMRGMLPPAH